MCSSRWSARSDKVIAACAVMGCSDRGLPGRLLQRLTLSTRPRSSTQNVLRYALRFGMIPQLTIDYHDTIGEWGRVRWGARVLDDSSDSRDRGRARARGAA